MQADVISLHILFPNPEPFNLIADCLIQELDGSFVLIQRATALHLDRIASNTWGLILFNKPIFLQSL